MNPPSKPSPSISETAPPPQAQPQPIGLRWWAVAIAVGLALTLAALFPWLSGWSRKPPSWSLYLPAVSTTLLLLLAMTRMFRTTELALVFVLQLTVCGVAGSGLTDTWFRVLFTKPIYASDPALVELGTSFPAVLSVDPGSATAARLTERMLIGQNNLSAGLPLAGELWSPMIIGGVIMLAGLAMVLGLLAFTHRQWSQHERLQHPLAEVSVTLCDGSWAQRGFIVAAAAMLALSLWDMTADWHGLPKLQLKLSVPELASICGVAQDPGSDTALSQWTTFEWRGYAVGLAFLLVPAIGFSLWSGFWLAMLVFGLLYSAGIPANFETDGRGVGGGAMVAFAVAVVWAGRHHYGALLRAAFGMGTAGGDRLGIWGLRVALGGSIIAAGMLSWAGGHWAAGLVGVLIVWLFLIVLARVVAESGVIAFQTAQDVVPFAYACGLPAMLPVSAIFAALWLGQTLCGDTRTSLAGLGTHATGLGQRSGLRLRTVLIAMAVILPIALALALTSRLWSGWVFGGQIPQDLAWRATELKSHLSRIDAGGWAMQPLPLLIGAGLVVMATGLRRWWPASPLHPVGLVCAFSFPIWIVWSSLMIGWAAKAVTLRWGGVDTYQRLRPIAMGLMVGDCCGLFARSLAVALGADPALVRI